jgi:lysophospholipase L1-like esterase
MTATGLLPERAIAPAPQASESQPRSPLRKARQCQVFFALILFVAVCQWAGKFKIGALPPQEFSFRSWTACAIQDFLKTPVQHPNVVFLGSSLLLVPINAVDADHLQKKLDCSFHHTSAYFKDQLDAATGLRASVFSFALPGEMPSDAYLLGKYFLAGERKPDLLIVGVGPRDFIDASLKSPMSTDPFEKLSRFGSLKDEHPFLAEDWETKFSWQLQDMFYFYKHQQELVLRSQGQVERVLSLIVPKDVRPISLALRRQLIPSYHFWEIGINDTVIAPTTKETANKYFDNSDEYRLRYRNFPATTFKQQTHFYEALLRLAHDRKIPAVVLGMPQTEIASKMISDSSWRKYETTAKSIARSNGASFIDFHHNPAFQAGDFADVVHLNARGGKKLLSMLARELATDPIAEPALLHSTTGSAPLSGSSVCR